jgi:hypothetical protein
MSSRCAWLGACNDIVYCIAQGTHDYIFNCQVILDSLSRQLQMDLRHITGESIFQGDRRALSNLVNILLRIATITG